MGNKTQRIFDFDQICSGLDEGSVFSYKYLPSPNRVLIGWRLPEDESKKPTDGSIKEISGLFEGYNESDLGDGVMTFVDSSGEILMFLMEGSMEQDVPAENMQGKPIVVQYKDEIFHIIFHCEVK